MQVLVFLCRAVAFYRLEGRDFCREKVNKLVILVAIVLKIDLYRLLVCSVTWYIALPMGCVVWTVAQDTA